VSLINLYDGNNVMRRAVETKYHIHGEQALTMRSRYEMQTAADIWVWDGWQHNERRRDIYPLYKMNRTPMAEDIFSQIRLWREVLAMSPATSIEVYGWESDDVIGTLVRKHPGKFKVHTNDMDYGQIAHLCELSGVNMKGVPPRWVALYKSMCGDSSDNIKGIPNFGPKRWIEMEDHWAQIERAIVIGTPAGFEGLPFKPAVKAWLAVPENIETLRAMLTVTHFMNVPDDELEGGIIKGQPDVYRARARLKEFFL